MKKILTFSISAIILLGVTACSNDDEANQTNNQNVNEDQTSTNETVNNANEVEEVQNDNEENQNNEDRETNSSQSQEVPNEIADFEETDQLKQVIDELNELQPEIETDNPNKRIILYADDSNDNQYKSIFIKEKNRLKIIELNESDGLLYNDTI